MNDAGRDMPAFSQLPGWLEWLKADNDKSCSKMKDKELAVFLNGFINLKRGKKEGAQPLVHFMLFTISGKTKYVSS